MAKIITEINPHCKLLVAKVGDLRSDLTSSRVVKVRVFWLAAIILAFCLLCIHLKHVVYADSI
jgi:hypothetical protein